MSEKRSLNRRSVLKTGIASPLIGGIIPALTPYPSSSAPMSKMERSAALQHEKHTVDFCVVGGGLAGICAAVAAARHGAKVAIIQDRPVFGGNASSEIRMHVCGAHGENHRETGIIDEIQMENCYRNPTSNYSIWDSVLYEKIRYEPNIEMFLNCSVNDIEMDESYIKSVTGWQLTTETFHTVEAKIFADCSGDSILAPLSGAEFRIGRESSSEFGEDIEPEKADEKTMGMSCLLQVRETASPTPFVPPSWAYVYESEDSFPHRDHDIHIKTNNFWWIELGGEGDSIHDTERLRDELLRIVFGVWDHIKNRGDHGAENWEIDWVGFLPGKRESRRYVGDHMLTQNDVRAEGRFDDLVCYGGWTMDDHNPAGFRYPGSPTIFHPAPSPFGIPYRSLYSKNIHNLFFAGRNISTTHAAMSATRVMATCATMGQAVGTAAAIALRDSLSPRGVYERRITELKQTLMDEDCWLPFNTRAVSDLTKSARLESSDGDARVLVNGHDRPVGKKFNGIRLPRNGTVSFSVDNPKSITRMRMTFDSDLRERIYLMPSSYPLNREMRRVPGFMPKSFRIEAEQGNRWTTVYRENNNYQRLVFAPLDVTAKKLRFVLEETWGEDHAHIFAMEIS